MKIAIEYQQSVKAVKLIVLAFSTYFLFWILHDSIPMALAITPNNTSSINEQLETYGENDKHIQRNISVLNLPDQTKFSLYNSTIFPSFSIKYPSDWEVINHENNDGIKFVNNFADQNNNSLFFDITVQQSRILVPLQIQLDIVIESYKNTLKNFSINDISELNFNNETALTLEFSYSNDTSGKIGASDTVILSNGYIYIMKYRVPIPQLENYIPILNYMINSFEVKNHNSSPEIKKKLSLITSNNTDPIMPGDTQTINFHVRDLNSSQPIQGADISGLADADTAFENRFTVYTDENGNGSHSWQIPSPYFLDKYSLLLWVNSSNYETEMYFRDFEIMSN